jgi:hypothetical protein
MSKKAKAGIEIPFEVADGIVVASLQEQRRYLKHELEQWTANPKTDSNPNGYWLHPEDVVKNTILIRSMDELIKYYGGEHE